MSSNPLKIAGPKSDKAGKKQCPPDMPRGDSNEAKARRAQFWIERGNAGLIEAGNHHLHWCHSNGNYWIEPY